MPKIVELNNFYKTIDQSLGSSDNVYGHFNIFRIEDMVLPKSRRATYSRRSFYKVTLINGHSVIHYPDRDVAIKGHALVFTNPAIQYYWELISEKPGGYMCVFTESFFHRFANIRELPVFQPADLAVIHLSPRQAARYKSLFLKMYNELQGKYRYKYDLLRCLLMEIIHEAQKAAPLSAAHFSGANAAERIAAAFTELMERQFPVELTYQVLQLHSPAAFAGQLGVHVNHLNKVLKKIKGRSTSHLINERILQEAKILLRSTNWTIAEIAYSLGFKEPNHFSAFFKSAAKTTAKNYREKNKD